MVLCLAVPGPLASACVAVAPPSRPGPRRLLGSGFVRAHARPAAPCVSPARSALLPPPPLGRQALSTWPPSLLHPPPSTRGELRPSCLLGDPCHLPHASSLPLGAASLLGQTPHPSGLRRWRWGGGLSSRGHSPTEEALRALGGWGWLVVLYVGRQAPSPEVAALAGCGRTHVPGADARGRLLAASLLFVPEAECRWQATCRSVTTFHATRCWRWARGSLGTHRR